MNNFRANYKKILEVLTTVTKKEDFLSQKHKPRLKDIELIAMNLTAEYMGIDSECQLFRDSPILLKAKIERSVYNRRKRKLFFAIEFIRNELSNKFTEFENYFVVDSMPLEVVKLSRSTRSKICKEEFYTSPNKGYFTVRVRICIITVIKYMLFVLLKVFLKVLILAKYRFMIFII